MNDFNPKQFTKSQDHLIYGSENDKSEMFILPPNILQKLGIDLKVNDFSPESENCLEDVKRNNHEFENMQSSKTPTLSNEGLKQCHVGLKQCHVENETSISNTAKLMKESIFLSPRFVKTTNDTGIVEIANSGISSLEHNANLKKETSNVDRQVEKECMSDDSSNKNCNSLDSHIEISDLRVNLQHNSGSALRNSNHSIRPTNIIMELNKLGAKNYGTGAVPSINEHLDKAYSSDFSNSNEQITETVADFSSVREQKDIINNCCKSYNKINIVSQEKVKNLKLCDLFCTNDMNLIPIPVNALLSKQKENSSNLIYSSDPSSTNPIITCKVNEENKIKITEDKNSITDSNLSDSIAPTSAIKCDIISRNTVLRKDITTKQCDFEQFLHASEESKSTIDNVEDLFPTMSEYADKDISLEPRSHKMAMKSDSFHSLPINNRISLVCKHTENIECCIVCTDTKNDENYSEDLLTESASKLLNNCSQYDQLNNTVSKHALKLETSSTLIVTDNKNINAHIGCVLDHEKRDFNLTEAAENSQYHKDNMESNSRERKLKNNKTWNSKKCSPVMNKYKSAQSKLLIQGTEKFGGFELVEKNLGKKQLKTYQKCPNIVVGKKQLQTYQKCPNIVVENYNYTLKDSSVAQNSESFVNSNSEIESCEVQDFCECVNFGMLKYFGFENLNDHLKLCDKTTFDGTVDDIFDIFKEDDANGTDKSETVSNVEYVVPEFPRVNIEIDKDGCEKKTTGSTDNIQIKQYTRNKPEKINTYNNYIKTSTTTQILKKKDETVAQINNVNKSTSLTSGSGILNKPLSDDCNKISPEFMNRIQNKSCSSELETNNEADKGTDGTCDERNDSITKKMEKKLKRTLSGVRKGSESIKDDVITPQRKKGVKCGVCEQLFANTLWPEHVENEHCFIAWKAEEDLDLQNGQLTRNLQKRLNNGTNLKCTFCATERNSVKKFLAHVQKCIKEKLTNVAKDKKIDCTNENKNNTLNANESDTVTCGVCLQDVAELQWFDHMQSHNYLAWRQGHDTPLDLEDVQSLYSYLHDINKKKGGLKCAKCGAVRKYVNPFLNHIKSCNGKNESGVGGSSVNSSMDSNGFFEIEINLREPIMDEAPVKSHVKNLREPIVDEAPVKSHVNSPVKCGVCLHQLEDKRWWGHVESHDYLTWKLGEPPLNLKNSDTVFKHLYAISKKCGKLKCSKCRYRTRYVKPYIEHVKSCGEKVGRGRSSKNVTLDSTACETDSSLDMSGLDTTTKESAPVIKCGVCQEEVESELWLEHIKQMHCYLAWPVGSPPLDVYDENAVFKHLSAVLKNHKALSCFKCGLVRKSVKPYLQHVQNCSIGESSLGNKPAKLASSTVKTKMEMLECAICSVKVCANAWRDHAMEEHYNVAWTTDDPPVDVNNAYVVEKYIKEYKSVYKNLVCKKCGITRVSNMGFYAHIIVCGKTDEETEMFKSICDVCNSKFLCVYKNQHMAMHREQLFARARKAQAAEELERKEAELREQGLLGEQSAGRRRAALKANNVIGKYSSEQMSKRKERSGDGSASDSDESTGSAYDSERVRDEQSSDRESEETGDDSDASRDEPRPERKSHNEYSLGETYEEIQASLRKEAIEFQETYYTRDTLFPEWRGCQYEAVPAEQLARYMPELEESCQVKFLDYDWTTYRRFEARQHPKTLEKSLFVGASVECVSWAPPRLAGPGEAGEHPGGHYLAVAAHRGREPARVRRDDTRRGPALLQIWDFGDFHTPPKLALGIALDVGTVMGMSWCPSGARDLPPLADAPDTAAPTDPADTAAPTDTGAPAAPARLGLLALACSDGITYVYSVPYPSAVVSNGNIFYKLKPVAELRQFRPQDTENKRYVATCVCWSPQKDHSRVVVGYASGSIAYYEFKSHSEIVNKWEDGVRIAFPIYSETAHMGSAVLDLDVCVTGSRSELHSGLVCSASHTGARVRSGADVPAARGARREWSRVPARCARFAPLHPTVLLAGDEALMCQMVTEWEWQSGEGGCGRRLGNVRALAGCSRCARVAAHAPPALRLYRLHPAFGEMRKQVIGLLRTLPLAGNTGRNGPIDELSEPLTYDDCVKQYGVQYVAAKEMPKSVQLSLLRYRLADAQALAFCPSWAHHSKLALATRSGHVFLVHT